MSTPSILEKINARKRTEIAVRSTDQPLELLCERCTDLIPARPFIESLRARVNAGQSAVIAEIKKASPSRGVLREDFAPAEIARRYAAGGAACLSVLTDADFFAGSTDDLQAARAGCALPVLRKDFIIDPYQVYETRAMGADCLLLIVAALDDRQLNELCGLAQEIGLAVLIEVHNQAELKIALATGNELLGINNRDLHNFSTRLETTLELLQQVPANRLLVSESGIKNRQDVARLREAGVNAFLVGEALMCQKDPGNALRELFFE
ncbi:MAG: indole-3-glycerol phosphate synthase TrpC [Cellvibrionales bacterium]|nr:indole-3-glycerol phosphate synthase TrpC [Cellvibrionales bacterium]